MPYTQAEIDALSTTPHFTGYENPAFGIKFVYPSNWELTENLTHVSVTVHPKNESDYSEMEVVVKDLSKNVTVDKYTDTVMRELKKKISNFTATTAQLTSLYGNMGNEYAKNFTFSGLYRQKPVQGLTVYTLNDNKAYILTFISQDPHFKLASEAEILIHSFEFYRNLKYSDVTIERHNSFDHGLLEFYTKFDNSYGGIGSSRIRLVVNDSNNAFFWVIFHNSSIYYPNSYRMAQNTNDTWTNKHNSLNQTIEYGKWYHVGLLFNDTDVSFYFNDALVETFKRPSNDSYTYLQLVTESAAVSFANVREITSSGTSELLIPMTSWYGTQGTFMAKKIDVSPIFTLVPIYPP
ncbi:MAG TPA: PsbP-related protein, partial [Nitrososphaeraceae archaeon]